MWSHPFIPREESRGSWDSTSFPHCSHNYLSLLPIEIFTPLIWYARYTICVAFLCLWDFQGEKKKRQQQRISIPLAFIVYMLVSLFLSHPTSPVVLHHLASTDLDCRSKDWMVREPCHPPGVFLHLTENSGVLLLEAYVITLLKGGVFHSFVKNTPGNGANSNVCRWKEKE